MKNTFLHTLNDSFRTWIENRILSEGEAFRNVSGTLYPSVSNSFPNKKVYSNPYGQWVFDSSVSGANIPSGVFVDGTFLPRGQSGLILDFEKGRAILNSSVNGNISASYATKDFNVYFTTLSDEELLFENKTQLRPKYNTRVTGVPENATYGPLIYVKRDSFHNEPFALGGEDLSVANYRAVIISNDLYNLDGAGSILADSAHSSFMLLPFPVLNRYGDIIGGNFNYTGVICENWNNSNLVYINEVEYYRFDSKVETSLGKELYCGFVEFKLELPRFPKISTQNIYPPSNTMLYYQTISLPSGIFTYDVVFSEGENLVSAELELPINSSGIYTLNTQNITNTGFTAVFNYILETGVNLLVTTSN